MALEFVIVKWGYINPPPLYRVKKWCRCKNMAAALYSEGPLSFCWLLKDKVINLSSIETAKFVNVISSYIFLVLFETGTCLGIDRVLLVATTSGLISISLETKDYTPLPLPYVSTDTQEWKIMHVDYDPIDKKVYVIDGESGVIRRCKFDGSEQEVLCK